MKINERLIINVVFGLGIISSIYFPFAHKPKNIQSRRNQFNATMLIDENYEEIPDVAMDCGIAGPTPGFGTYYWSRKPNKKEITLFENNTFGLYNIKDYYRKGLTNIENIVH